MFIVKKKQEERPNNLFSIEQQMRNKVMPSNQSQNQLNNSQTRKELWRGLK
jgi:hypothetical protein